MGFNRPTDEVIRGTDDHGVGLQATELAQAGGQNKAALRVELDLKRAGKQEASESACAGVGVTLGTR